MAIVEFENAKFQLRSEDEEDAFVLFQLELASSIVLDYLKLPEGTWNLSSTDSGSGSESGSSGGEVAPLQVQAAVLMVLGELYKNRETNAVPLSDSVKDLLRRSRHPAYA